MRALVAMALSEAASPQVVDPLVRLIQNSDEDAEAVRAAVSGLGRTGDPRAAAPLFSLMQKRPEMRQSVIDALAKSTAAPQLAVLLGQANEVHCQARPGAAAAQDRGSTRGGRARGRGRRSGRGHA